MYNQWLVLAYLENPADFPMVSTCLQLSVPNHATAHTPNVVRHLKKTVKYKKIRGLKRKVAKIQNWVEEYLELDIEQLYEQEYHYSKVYVQPWDNLTLTNSEIPEPKGKAKKEIINGLEKIYNSWKKELDKINQPYYLKIWLNEPRLSKSQVVCAIGEKIEHYANVFNKADFKENSSSFTKLAISE